MRRLAALEPHFWERLLQELGMSSDDRRNVERIFKTTEHWEDRATARDLIAAVREVERD